MMNNTNNTEKKLTDYPSMIMGLEFDFTAMRIFFGVISSLVLVFALFILPNIGRCRLEKQYQMINKDNK